MRRRWLLILGGALVLVVIAVLALALRAPSGPFAFLRGQEPIWERGGDGEEAIYTWQARWEEVIARAEEELFPAGFVPTRSAGGLRDDISDLRGVTFIRKRASSPLEPDIVRIDDMRAYSAQEFELDCGWVTVTLELGKPPSLWERIMAVFGL